MAGGRGVYGEGVHAWQRGACMAKGGVNGRGGMHSMHVPPSTRYGRSMRRWYASY